MFYSHSILAKSGPFAHVWLAATWEKKVTRSMIFGTDIATFVESIANPAAPLARHCGWHSWKLMSDFSAFARRLRRL